MRFKDFIWTSFHYCMKLLSCIFIKSSKIYVFGSWFGEKYADNSKAMYEYYLKHSNKKCYWVTKNKNIYQMLINEKKPVILFSSIKGIWIQLHAKVCFVCTGDDVNLSCMGRSIMIQLWHGVGGGKKIGYDAGWYNNKWIRFFTKANTKLHKKVYWLGTSGNMRQIHKSAFHLSDDQFIIAGQPRNDLFYDSNYSFSTVNEFISDKKVILYAPTHRKEGKTPIDLKKRIDLDYLDNFCKQNNILFIVKLHFYHSKEQLDTSKYTNIIDITNYKCDINELLMISDCLISDYSSITADYLLLNKPIIYFCYDYEDYVKNDRDLYWQYSDITPGEKCNTGEELIKEIENIFTNDIDKYSENRVFVRRMFYDDECCRESASVISNYIDTLCFKKNTKVKENHNIEKND